jgi:hypothetical protein
MVKPTSRRGGVKRDQMKSNWDGIEGHTFFHQRDCADRYARVGSGETIVCDGRWRMSGSGVILLERNNQVALRPKPTSKALIHRDISRRETAASGLSDRR